MESDPKPARSMSDLGPRRSMDMVRRPSAAPTAAPPKAASRPESVAPPPKPAGRPAPPPAAPAPPKPTTRAAKPAAPTAALADATASSQQPTAKPRRGTWWIILQFIIGLAVIVGVAVAVIALYLKYYQ